MTKTKVLKTVAYCATIIGVNIAFLLAGEHETKDDEPVVYFLIDYFCLIAYFCGIVASAISHKR